MKSKAGQEQTQGQLPWCVALRPQLYEEDKGKREWSNLNNLNFILNT